MSGKGQKHKRGERGSVEEEINIAKKQNMEAASQDPEVHNSSAHGEEGHQPSSEKESVRSLQSERSRTTSSKYPANTPRNASGKQKCGEQIEGPNSLAQQAIN